jgi:hypothetical protein
MDKERSNSETHSLVDEVSEEVSTDVIADLKSGIYNLFISLYSHLIIDVGVEEAVRQSTSFIDEISLNFKQITKKDTES